jgi:hypothetical protein
MAPVSDLLGDGSFEDDLATHNLVAPTAGNAPPNARHLAGLLVAKTSVAPLQP